MADLNDMEFDLIFSKPIREYRFCTEETSKMIESRLEHLADYIRQSEVESAGYKSAKTEMSRSVEGLEILIQSVIERLKKNLEKAFDKLEGDK